MLDKILEIDKALMVFLNKSISNSFFDIIMPIITSKDFLTVIGVILIIYLGFFCGKRGKITLLVLLFAAGMSDAICAQIIKTIPIAVKKSLLVIIGMTKSKKEFEILLFKNTINTLSTSRILSSIETFFTR